MVSWTNNLGLIKTDENPAYDNNFIEIDTRYADLNSAIKSLQNRFGVNNIAFNKNKYYLTAVSNEKITLKPESGSTLTEYKFSSLIDGEAYVVSFVNSQAGEGLTESTDPTKLKLANNDLVVKLTKEINGIFQPYFVVIQNVVGFGYVPKEITQTASSANVVFEKVFASSMEAQPNEYTFNLNSLVAPALITKILLQVESIKEDIDNGEPTEVSLSPTSESYDGIFYETTSHSIEFFWKHWEEDWYEYVFKKIILDYYIRNGVLFIKWDPFYINTFMREGKIEEGSEEDRDNILIIIKHFLEPGVTLS